MMPFLNYHARSHTGKQKLQGKPGSTLSEKRERKKKKLLKRLFPLLQLRFKTNKERGNYQHAKSK